MAATTRRPAAWRTPSFTADGLKLFACAAMLLSDIGLSVIERGWIRIDQYQGDELSNAMAESSALMVQAGIGSVLQLLGGLAIPVFAFLLSEGFRKTSSYARYLCAVALTALISEIPYDLAMQGRLVDWSSQNALASMAICLLMLYFLRMIRERLKGSMAVLTELLIVACAIFWVTLFRSQHGFCLVLLTAVFYLLYKRNGLRILLGILVVLIHAVVNPTYMSGLLSFYGIFCYTGERKDKLPKYAYYAFYPLHLLALGVTVALMRKMT